MLAEIAGERQPPLDRRLAGPDRDLRLETCLHLVPGAADLELDEVVEVALVPSEILLDGEARTALLTEDEHGVVVPAADAGKTPPARLRPV